jgi:hypothetical protein
LKPIITLTTDFGTSDHYVAAVKGVILGINPDATIVDLSHGVEPQGIEQAAFILSCALPFFPQGSIHVAVVDPEVGTQRRALALYTDEGVFIGPDNGVLSPAFSDDEREGAYTKTAVIRLDIWQAGTPTGQRALSTFSPKCYLPRAGYFRTGGGIHLRWRQAIRSWSLRAGDYGASAIPSRPG